MIPLESAPYVAGARGARQLPPSWNIPQTAASLPHSTQSSSERSNTLPLEIDREDNEDHAQSQKERHCKPLILGSLLHGRSAGSSLAPRPGPDYRPARVPP